MKKSAKQWLFWTPRVLVMLFAAFVSIFALDVFGAGTLAHIRLRPLSLPEYLPRSNDARH